MVIESVHVGDRPLSPFSVNPSLHQGDCVGFRFLSPTLLAPEQVVFEYRLDGLDEGWTSVAPGALRYAHYHWPDPGSYRFRVRARNGDGIWSTGEAAFAFRIEPAPGSRAWIYWVSALAVIAGLAVFSLALAKRSRRLKAGTKYERSPLAREQTDQIKRALIRALEVDQIYRDPSLTLASLARRLSVTTHQLSQVMNESLERSFFDLINGYRVEEAKSQLTTSAAGEKTVLDIAMAVGFNSQAAFYRAFKRFTDMSPSQYRQRQSGKS